MTQKFFKNILGIVMMVPLDSGPKFFELDRWQGHLVSSECLIKKCDAKKSLNLFKPAVLQIGIDGYVKNPYSQLCLSAKGRGVILQDINQNQHYFCEFNDGSLIGMASVNYQDPKK